MSEQAEAEGSFLKTCRDLAFIAAIYLYFIGFVHIRAFYNEFGLSISSADVQVYYPIIYSYEVLTRLPCWMWLTILVGGGLMFYGVYRCPKKAWRLVLTLIIGIVVLVILGYEANLSGAKHAREFRAGYGAHTIRLTFSPALSRQLPKDLIELNDEGRLWLLSATKDRYLVCYQPTMIDNELPYARVFAIPTDNIAVAETEARNEKLQIQ